MKDGIRTVVTSSSVWKFDTTLTHYVRFPRGEAPDPGTVIPYTSTWEPYTGLERYGDRIIVHRPVRWGAGAMRMTGAIEWDDVEAEDLLEIADHRWGSPPISSGAQVRQRAAEGR